MKELH